MAVKKTNRLGLIKQALKDFRQSRLTKDELEAAIKRQQPEIIDLMKSLDPDNNGIVYDPDNEEKGAAYVQQNTGTEEWDHEAIVEFLHNRKSRALWNACSSRVFDVQKWELEIANGNIPKKTAKKFLVKRPDPQPFIRFGKIKKGNL